jgi:rod shape-determining protein MreC
MSDEQVAPGDIVLTSGGDQIFPKGLPVGTVSKVSTGKDLFLNIKIRPAANLSKLEEVLVVMEKQERQATAHDTVRMRAADILAQRLPSVPEKPAVPEAKIGSAAGNAGTPANAPEAGSGAKPQSKAAIVPIPQNMNVSKTRKPIGTANAKREGTPVGPATPASMGSIVLEPGTGEPKAAPKAATPQPNAPATEKPAPPNSQPPASDDSPH